MGAIWGDHLMPGAFPAPWGPLGSSGGLGQSAHPTKPSSRLPREPQAAPRGSEGAAERGLEGGTAGGFHGHQQPSARQPLGNLGPCSPPDTAGDRNSCQSPKAWQGREKCQPRQDPDLGTHLDTPGASHFASPGGTFTQESKGGPS